MMAHVLTVYNECLTHSSRPCESYPEGQEIGEPLVIVGRDRPSSGRRVVWRNETKRELPNRTFLLFFCEMIDLLRAGVPRTYHHPVFRANWAWEIFIFPVQLTTSRIGNLTRLTVSILCYM